MDKRDLFSKTPARIQTSKDGMDASKPVEVIGSEDLDATITGYELESEKEMRKDYRLPAKTIMDDTVAEVFENTLDFMRYSGDKYMKYVYQVKNEEKEKGSEKTSLSQVRTHLVALSLFCREDANAIYLGILLILVSLIIYFMSIVSHTNGVSEST